MLSVEVIVEFENLGRGFLEVVGTFAAGKVSGRVEILRGRNQPQEIWQRMLSFTNILGRASIIGESGQ